MELLGIGFFILLLFLFSYRAVTETNFSKEDKKDYMESLDWQIIRLKAMKRDDYECVTCGAISGLEVHHITYSRLGNEKLSDLATLCRDCHQAVHDKYGYDYGTYYPVDK